jgi:hypothetical protein
MVRGGVLRQSTEHRGGSIPPQPWGSAHTSASQPLRAQDLPFGLSPSAICLHRRRLGRHPLASVGSARGLAAALTLWVAHSHL